jgi:Ser/Thr protein kinase RdoA (MazF antagonist)
MTKNTSTYTIAYPTFSLLEAQKFASQHFGIQVKAKNLVSYADQNIYLKEENGNEYVLKIMNDSADKNILYVQNAAMSFLYGKIEDFSMPQVFLNAQGEDITEIYDENGNRYYMRLLSWVKGELWENAMPHTLKLCEELGTKLGKMSDIFQDFVPPCNFPKKETFRWDSSDALWVYDKFQNIDNEEDREILIHFWRYYKDNIFPNLVELREGFIQNDANTFNLLVKTTEKTLKVSGLIDFGEMMKSKIVGELAVCCAYIAMNNENPLEIAAAIIKGYNSVFPLNDAEMQAIFPLMANRVMISVTYSAINHKNGISGEYLYASEKPGWELLKKLRKVSPNTAYSYFREACGLSDEAEMRVGLVSE